MNTPNIDSFFTEVAALRNSQDSLRIKNENLKRELAERPTWQVIEDQHFEIAMLYNDVAELKKELAQQSSWAIAAEYRDQVLELEKLCKEQAQRIDALHTWKKNALLCFQNLTTAQTNEY
jgi:hypothetical protein